MIIDAEKDIRFYCGTSGSGKSHQIKEDIENEKRVLIFDPEGEYSSKGGKFKTAKAFTQMQPFVEAVEKNKNGNFRFALQADGAQAFEFFCMVNWVLAQDVHKPVVCAVDELAGVEKTASKAQGTWHKILTRGRKHQIKVRAGAQSPTEVSKTIMRQRSHLWVGHMTRMPDWQYIANEIPVTVEDLRGLRPAPYFDSISHIQGKEPVINK